MAVSQQPTDLHKWMSTGSLFLPYGTAEDYAQEEETISDQACNMVNADSLDLETFKINEGMRKYRDALKVLLPVRPHQKDKLAMPSHKAGLFSYITLTWITKLMWKAYRQGIHHEDLWQVAPTDTAELNVKRLERLWKDEQLIHGEKAQFWAAVTKFCRTRGIIAGLLICMGMTFQFLGPSVLLRHILLFLDDRSAGVGQGVLLAALLVATQLMRSGCMSMAWVTSAHTAVRVQSAIQLLFYRRMLKVHIDDKVSAQVINHVTNDMERIFDAAMNGILVLGTPVMFVLTLGYSCSLIGPWALVGNVVILLFYPIMGGIAAVIAGLRRQVVKKADERVHLMTEIINNVRLIKMCAWEDPFSANIKRVRSEEKRILVKGNFLQSLSVTATPIIMIMATVTTLVGYTLSGNTLSASDAFTIFALFNGMGFSIGTLPYAIRAMTEAKVALQRMQELLEINDAHMWSKKVIDDKDKRFAVTISDAAFTWQVVSRPVKSVDIVKKRFQGVPSEQKSKARATCNGENGERALIEDGYSGPEEALRDITLHIKKGSLIGICGSVGSGKSSLLAALCGDMNLIRGEIDVNGSIAIVTQQAWIFNATIRDNILFGLPFLKSRYDMVIDACCLTPDLERLGSGDLTEIGERGVTLSGGQRQRINIARALYSDRDTYLLDDPLSAVDAKVANHLFEKCIQSAMQGKTVFLVSHSMHVLERCQQILFMKGGRIIERGTHAALMSFSGEYRKMFQLDTAGRTKAKVESGGGGDAGEDGVNSSPNHVHKYKSEEEDSVPGSKLVKEEERAEGSISWATYRHFIQACGGPCAVLLLALAFLAFVSAQMFTFVWLQHWVDKMKTVTHASNHTSHNVSSAASNDTIQESQVFYGTVYGITIPIMFILGIIKGALCTLVLLSAATKLHDQMFHGVLRSPIQFFDATPSGRVTNRFSKDMDEVDIRVPFFMEMVLQSLLAVFLQLLISVFVYQLFFVVLAVIIALYVLLDHWLNVGVREVKRLDNVARSSVIVHLTTTLQGVSVIRVFECQKWFTNKMYQLVNKHSVAHLVFHLCSRWFTLRLELIGICMVATAALVVVLTRSVVTTGMAGLMLSTICSTCTFIPFIMRLKSELLARFTSVERIHEYCQNLPEKEVSSPGPAAAPPGDWPRTGEIKYQDVCLKYRAGLPLALKNVAFHIKGGQKVGIVGRTGAGKSSILVSLMRLQELESGHIYLDDVDIGTLRLKQLRSSVAVIPQDPVLFQGTVRYNLDPLNKNSDVDLWTALEKAHLKIRIQREEKQLECVVDKNGENFSVGERQLMCLARALLRRNKILVLDEATASVDAETDQLIQQTIREVFADCTILTIAHRLNTVLKCDIILVLENGKVVEMDSPFQLVNDPKSIFSSMLNAVGMTVPGNSTSS
ncbi:ATP-binding cassette sub-family C member 5-like [Ornithodoros turicata]|uniref:ATP-binding cassette sub-family C member 5-like n=1 Tax=Ornithodoros turicata TaxID=34597 RepID=UPI003139FC22